MKVINHSVLRALRPGDSVADSACRGLRAVGYQNGSKKFIYRFNQPGTRQLKQVTIGDAATMAVADARIEVERLRQHRKEGEDPRQVVKADVAVNVADAGRGDYTVRNLIDDFHRERLALTARGNERLRTLNHDLKAMMNKPVSELRRVHIQKLVEGIAERGAANTSGRVLRDLRAAIEHAVVHERLPDNCDPCRGVRLSDDAKYRPRERHFTTAEWKVWLKWLPKSGMSGNVQDGLMLTGLTAQRSGEVIKMKWADVVDGTWTIRNSKRRKLHLVFLNPQAQAILKRRKRGNDSPFVFPSPKYDDRPMRQHALVWAISKLRDCPVPDWGAHDLRRSAITLLQSKGLGEDLRRRLGGHYAVRRPSDIYARHGYDAEARKAWTLLGKTIAAMSKT